MFDIREELKKLPDSPGVYLHKDEKGEIIYVGKALSLRNRVRQYFQSPARQDPKVRAMVSHIAEFEIRRTDSEMEALILECSLIKKYLPRYNVLLRDDKTYPYIKVTFNEQWPRVIKTRRLLEDGGVYFGPYPDAGAVNQIVDLLSAIYSLKRCATGTFAQNARPCLHYHIGRCQGLCTGATSPEEYRKSVDLAVDFLRGNSRDVLQDLEGRMLRESELLHYEKAAEYRDYIALVRSISDMIANLNGMAKKARRQKRQADRGQKTASFRAALGPFAKWAPEASDSVDSESGPPLRVEAYDISNTAGVDSVGAMVVFEDGFPRKKDYRRFRIRTIEGADDAGSLGEMLYRRMKRGVEASPGFEILPGLILMDGGRNQTAAAEESLKALGLSIPVAGMVKDDKHRSRALLVGDTEIPLREVPGLGRWIGAIQEEVHRFAIDYHRGLRTGSMRRSVLDDIPGVGEKRKQALLTRFGSIDAIAASSLEDLAAVPGMNRPVAEEINRRLNNFDCEKNST